MNSSGTSRPASVNALRMAATFGPKMVLRLSRHHSFESADGGDRALEARHHVAREQLVALQRLLAVGPFMGAEQEAAEAAAGQLEQPLDALDRQSRAIRPASCPSSRPRAADRRRGRAAAPASPRSRSRSRAARLRAPGACASSSSSARCTLTTSRHLPRSIVLPCLAAVSSPIFHCSAMASGPPGRPAPSESTPRPCLPAAVTPDGVMHARHGDREMRVGVGREVQPRLVQLEPVGLHRDRLVALEQRHDGVERLVHALALGAGLDAHHVGVGHERARARSPAWRGRASCGRAGRSGWRPAADGDRAGWSRRSRA